MTAEKQLYRDFHRELLDSAPGAASVICAARLSADFEWHGPHPIKQARGPRRYATEIWEPLARSFTNLRRRDDILMGGNFEGQSWVACTGHYYGTFSGDWLGIPASGSAVSLRFGEFARVSDGRIDELRTLFDLVALCRQAGIRLLPPDAGSEAAVPAPATGDGVMLEAASPERGQASLQRVEEMIDGLLAFDGENLGSMGMERFWTPDMRWYGPAGIGTTYGLDGFQSHHQGPFLKAFPDRTAAPHTALFAEGDYVCVTGWPSVIGSHNGPYLGLPASGTRVGMQVMDFWRQENGRLAENWVLIDMLDLFMQLGVDVLKSGLEKAAE